MKTLRKYFSFLVIALGLSTQCFAFQNNNMSYDQSVESENYYVQPGGVCVAPNGIFVLLNGHLVQVNMLETDERGVFVPGPEMNRQFIYCPICQHWFEPSEYPTHRCK